MNIFEAFQKLSEGYQIKIGEMWYEPDLVGDEVEIHAGHTTYSVDPTRTDFE